MAAIIVDIIWTNGRKYRACKCSSCKQLIVKTNNLLPENCPNCEQKFNAYLDSYEISAQKSINELDACKNTINKYIDFNRRACMMDLFIEGIKNNIKRKLPAFYNGESNET